MNRIIAIGGVIAVVALGGLWWISGQGSAPGLDLPSAANAQDSEVDTSLAGEMTQGNPDAPVTVIEYASFTCPHCANFHEGSYQQLKTDYIDTGKINFIYREVYFDKFGLWAGMMARCGGTTERYFAISDLIYRNQPGWTDGSNDQEIVGNLMQLGKSAGFTGEQLEACLQDEELANALVASYQENATADGIGSTPSFVINGKLYTNMSYADFEKALVEAGVE